MRILHISDIHYRKKFGNSNVYESILANMDSSLSKLETLLNSVSNIDCLCITGDLCDDGDEDDYRTLKDLLDRFKLPYFLCLGNHDDKKAFYKGFYNKDYSGPYLKDNVFNDIHIISFDNSEYNYPNGYLDKDRLDWLKDKVNNYPNAIILMHHQLYDMPGILALDNKNEFLKIINNNVLTILNGHTHWYKKEDNTYTAPSISFRAINTNNGVEFYDCFGYCIYEVNNNSISLIAEKDIQGKLLGIWNPKGGKLY